MTRSKYKFTCICKTGAVILGSYVYNTNKFNRDELTQSIMGQIARFVTEEPVPWDPFNIKLIVKAQGESKP